MTSAGIHDSIMVPPHEASTNPMGTCNSSCSFFPKKYPTALKFFKAEESHTAHAPMQLFWGDAAVERCILKKRMALFLAFGRSAAAPGAHDLAGFSMLDCPEHSHTSRIGILPNTFLFSPAAVIE